jgi:tryptophan 2,3-dioxygenase
MGYGDDQNSNKSGEFKTLGAKDLTYMSYLKVDELLKLQNLVSEPKHHDEMLFIIIHQAYEIWFKLILHELEKAAEHMKKKEVLSANHFVKRVVEIMRILVPQIQLLATMTPKDFLEFRSRINPASGFQSVQFREIEFFAGLQEPRYLEYLKNVPGAVPRLQARMASPTLGQIYLEMIRGLGFALPENLNPADLDKNELDMNQVLTTLRQIYMSPYKFLEIYQLSESLLDFDEYLSLWRYHHVMTVERIIGMKVGTGGSPGANYLRTTTSKQCFPFLWKVRTIL